MKAVDLISIFFGAFGAISGGLVAWASLRNALTGRQNQLVQTATFLQTEVRRLTEEVKSRDEELEEKTRENIALEQENIRLRRMVARRPRDERKQT